MIPPENQEVEEVEGSKRIVILGGSFSQIHKGHLSLLRKALSISKEIRIGLVQNPSDKLFGDLIEDFDVRKSNLLKAVLKIDERANVEIFPINDPYGPSIHQSDLTDIVCTVETLARSLEVNKKRLERGLKPLKVHFVELSKAEDGRPIRSSRIRAGEIDSEGKLLVKEVKIIYDE